MIKRKQGRKLAFAITRMLRGERKDQREKLKAEGLSGLVQTAFIERVNLTIRRSVAPLMRKTWSLAQTEEALLLHLEWWRLYYHFVRLHSALKKPIKRRRRRWQQDWQRE